ncbi:MAG: 1-(5-phosphoribosyl)-5-[(5-phosphoribosylamino)methylideneamino]imidazole-4-carboxamide isomerase [Firmicutes bacterium]|nr:1-(5-phosphoribosyl)-5-[(5-phosphoribosylamino)methylideneamino]imidazole-4-carboxamide isomerase [Bacillota bacterium]
MIVFPAIDLRAGKVVRLTQGDYGRMDVYGDDPVQTAENFREAGAAHLHVVDLDGARDGAPRNHDTLAALAAAEGLFTQAGGGIRTPERVDAYLSLGIDRVILGTAALRDPAFLRAMVAAHGEKIAVGVDAKDGKVAVEGWRNVSDTDAMAFCRHLRDLGVQTVIYTDIAKDGRLSGTNLPAYEALGKLSGLSIVASGGVSSEAEIKTLRDMGLYGVIVGKALYEKRLALDRVLSIAKGVLSS